MFELVQISYSKVQDYVKYCAAYPHLVGEHGDLKDVQRPWVLETLKEFLPAQSKILDLGGAACQLASALMDEYKVTVVDPYGGAGSGPTNVELYRTKYPRLNIIKGVLDSHTEIRDQQAVFSTSVVEHIDPQYHEETVSGISQCLAPGGLSIHSIDFTCKGVNGFLESQIPLSSSWINTHGIEYDLQKFSEQMRQDIEAYFLPVTMYMCWKKDRAYTSYPWRLVGSLNVVMRKNP